MVGTPSALEGLSMMKCIHWWEVKDSGGNRLHQPPELDQLDDEMANKVWDDSGPLLGKTHTAKLAGPCITAIALRR
jgi:hypothetical protein